MNAIITKYHGATNFKGARISASDGVGKRVTISYPYELSGEFAHREAAMAFVKANGYLERARLITGLYTVLAPGELKDGYVYVWCAASCARGYGECSPFLVTEPMHEKYHAVPAWCEGYGR